MSNIFTFEILSFEAKNSPKVTIKLTSAFPVQVNIHIYSDFCLMMQKLKENGYCKKSQKTMNDNCVKIMQVQTSHLKN
jgi:hypothetical protein